jgi:hypothetical protein
MSVSVERARGHVTEWSRKLAPFPTRSNWPSHLFHTCQLEVALEIVRAEKVLCRKDVPELIYDVANPDSRIRSWKIVFCDFLDS